MVDRHDAHDNLNQTSRDTRDGAGSADHLAADREVPLPAMTAADGQDNVVQLWLDGEATEADARRSNNSAVEIWMRVQRDAGQMHQVKAPAHLAANIMAALAPKAPLAD
ncbi:hypothetical protein [Gemmatimonas sp.]|uniref:hypothetical protein n=1 Tax=Gemmatimonas sp. TaxID=1962908 RepID=UPI00391B4F6E